MAAVPASGGSMMDGTADPLWSPSGCPQYVAASQCVAPAQAGPARPQARHWNDYGDSEW
jgi:hypothetical protein